MRIFLTLPIIAAITLSSPLGNIQVRYNGSFEMSMQRMTRISRRDVDGTAHIFEVGNIGRVREREVGGRGIKKERASYFLHIEPDD